MAGDRPQQPRWLLGFPSGSASQVQNVEHHILKNQISFMCFFSEQSKILCFAAMKHKALALFCNCYLNSLLHLCIPTRTARKRRSTWQGNLTLVASSLHCVFGWHFHTRTATHSIIFAGSPCAAAPPPPPSQLNCKQYLAAQKVA